MTALYLVRHGQTENNVLGKTQGFNDSPLTAAGIEQACALGEAFKDSEIHFDAAYASDLKRAAITRDLILDTMDHEKVNEIPRYNMPSLREVNWGDLSGKDSSVFENVDWDRDYEKYHGESFEQVMIRSIQSLLLIVKRHPDQNVLVVAHGWNLLSTWYALSKREGVDWPDGDVHMHNGSILILGGDGEHLEIQEAIMPGFWNSVSQTCEGDSEEISA